jgi:hypothetical protein
MWTCYFQVIFIHIRLWNLFISKFEIFKNLIIFFLKSINFFFLFFIKETRLWITRNKETILFWILSLIFRLFKETGEMKKWNKFILKKIKFVSTEMICQVSVDYMWLILILLFFRHLKVFIKNKLQIIHWSLITNIILMEFNFRVSLKK